MRAGSDGPRWLRAPRGVKARTTHDTCAIRGCSNPPDLPPTARVTARGFGLVNRDARSACISIAASGSLHCFNGRSAALSRAVLGSLVFICDCRRICSSNYYPVLLYWPCGVSPAVAGETEESDSRWVCVCTLSGSAVRSSPPVPGSCRLTSTVLFDEMSSGTKKAKTAPLGATACRAHSIVISCQPFTLRSRKDKPPLPLPPTRPRPHPLVNH